MLLTLTWLACAPAPPPPSPLPRASADTAGSAPSDAPTVTASPATPSVRWLSWSGGTATVTVQVGDRTHRWSDATAPLALMGLPAGVTASAEVATADTTWALTVETPPPPPGLDTVHLTFDAGSETGTGFVLVHAFDRPSGVAYAAVLDGAGQVVWWREDPDGRKVVRARLDAAGTGVWWAVTDWSQAPGRGAIHHTALDGSTESTWATPDLHHDFVERDGALHYLAHEIDPDTHIGIVPQTPTASDRVRTLDLDDGRIHDGFAFFDHYPHAPWSPCDHALLPSFVPGAVEWTHSNSLLPWGEGWLLLPRYLDAFVAVEGDTFLWQAGGRDTTLQPVDADAVVRHAHATQVLDDDRVLVFDNRSHLEGAVSRVVELRIDPQTGTYAAEHVLEEPRGRYVDFLGDARRLPAGHTLVAWSPYGELEELGPDGTAYWHLQADLVLGRVEFLPALPGG